MIITGLSNFDAFSQGGWYLQNNPTTNEGQSTKFVSATEGWINLSSNALLHTTNGGANWNVVVPNATDICFGYDATGKTLSFINSSTGWVMKTLSNANQDALGAVVYKTTNGGATWNRTVVSNTLGDVGIQLQFVDANNGWASIYNDNTQAIIFKKTTNGGATWTPTNGGGIFNFVNSTTGWAFPAGPNILPPYTIYKTTDGGTNWTPQYVDNTAGELNSMHFTDATHGWIVGENGKIFKTTDGGTTWNASVYNSNYRFNHVFFINNNEGWISTRDNSDDNIPFMLHTTNGGSTWSTQELPFNSKVYSMYFWDANNGWATSDSYNINEEDYPGQIAKYLYDPAGTYTNATLNGPWLFFTDVTPIDPFNNNLNYFVFDGNGNITDFNGFGGPWIGSSYSVNSSGVLNGTITNGSESFPFNGLLTSATEVTAQIAGQNWRLHKIANPGALKDKITGTLTTDGCGSRDVTLNIDNNGIITSATGLTGPVVGRVYTDLGVYIGHMTTGEGNDSHWGELSIMGYYSNNNLVGQLGLDDDSQNPNCTNTTSNLVRSDNLGINDNDEVKNITIYPNPNNGIFYFELKEPKAKLQIEIVNFLGQKVYETTIFDNITTNKIYFEPQSKGMYFIKIYDGENIYKEKILIK
ncbi:MAG: hypothetical protein C0512_06000 [Flavobacterium sp.]|nr:hypothetical protein [Flavobacterium sp.]